jgi:hypothetical protein
VISDDFILSEAIRLVDDGVAVTFPVNGVSMLPFIVGGSEKVILERPEGCKRGSVVLAKVETGNYVIHRIVAIDGNHVTLMGDGNLSLREHCNWADVRAKVVYVVSAKGKKRSLETFWRKCAAKLWYILLPFRRYFLWFYKRVKL